VERTKPHTLTSPWKVGFLVSLLLVAMSIGVSYFLTRAFGISWHWVDFPSSSWRTWVFHTEAFMTEMLPLVVLVGGFSLFSYILITGAVRKYRSYVDSGLDYKNLVQSLATIEDLGDEKRIKKLAQYPELRDSLLKIGMKIKEKTEALEVREMALTDGVADNEAIGGEASLLVSAIMNGNEGGFNSSLSLSVPELRRIEEAIRAHLLVDKASSDARVQTIRAELTLATAGITSQLSEMRSEFVEIESAAREIEAQVVCLNDALGRPAPAAVPSGANGALDSLDNIASALAELGDDAKSIAINTAMQAGQPDAANGAHATLIEMAEDVRNIAARFGSISTQWSPAAEQLRGTSQSTSVDGDIRAAADLVARRVSMWVERAVMLSDKLDSLLMQHGEIASELAMEIDGSENTQYHSVDLEVEDLRREGSSPTSDDDRVITTSDFELQSNEPVFEDIPTRVEGLVTETELFDEISVPSTEDTPSAMFEEIHPAEGVADEPAEVTSDEPAEMTSDEPAEMTSDEPAEVTSDEPAEVTSDEPAEDLSFDDGFIKDPAQGSEYPAADDPDADAIDLYELGAVDYEPQGVRPGA